MGEHSWLWRCLEDIQCTHISYLPRLPSLHKSSKRGKSGSDSTLTHFVALTGSWKEAYSASYMHGEIKPPPRADKTVRFGLVLHVFRKPMALFVLATSHCCMILISSATDSWCIWFTGRSRTSQTPHPLPATKAWGERKWSKTQSCHTYSLRRK